MLQPLGDRIIIEITKPKEQTVGGIVLASNAKQKPQTGTVVAVGPGKLSASGKRIKPSVKEGDEVLYDKYSGTSVKYQGKSLLVLHNKDIAAIVK